MPKIVDHEHRRRLVAKIVLDTIAAVGPERTTLREIARRGGFSHTSLHHYFRNLDDVLGFAYEYLTETVVTRMQERAAAIDGGGSRLYTALDSACPYRFGIGAVTTLAFWVQTVSGKRAARTQRLAYGVLRRSIRLFIEEARIEGHIATPLDTDELVDLSVIFLDGLCVAASLEKRACGRRRQVELLDSFFETTFRPIHGRSTKPRQHE